MNEILLTKEAYNYFQAFLESLEVLFNEYKQRVAWRDGDYQKYISFSEVYMGFADLCEDILTWHSLPITKKKHLETLYKMLEDYSARYDAEELTEKEVYSDPEWDKIRVFARKVHSELKEVKLIEE